MERNDKQDRNTFDKKEFGDTGKQHGNYLPCGQNERVQNMSGVNKSLAIEKITHFLFESQRETRRQPDLVHIHKHNK